MKLTQIEKKEVQIVTRKTKEEYLNLLKEFEKSDMESARVDDIVGVQKASVYQTLQKIIKAYNFHIHVAKVKNEIYLIRI